MRLGYWLVRTIGWGIVFLQMRLCVRNRERVPRSGGVLLVANHLGHADALVIPLRLAREVRILGKAEVFDRFFIGWAARLAGAIPIRSGESDRAALATIKRLLESGECVLVFPEGSYRNPDEPPGLLPFKTGAAWLAMRTQVPVVPVSVWGTERVWHSTRGWRLWHRPRVEVVFGEPYTPDVPSGTPTKVAVESLADDMAQRIIGPLPEVYRGSYAHTITGARR